MYNPPIPKKRFHPNIKSVLVIGSGPIVIGQACEFDYSGVQALKVLKARGVRTVLLNPNPATIMTDPALADRTYIEPLTVAVLDWVLAREKVEAVLPTMGGQTGLNLAMEAHRRGIFGRRGARLIGASAEAIRCAEDRMAFRERMSRAGLPLPRGLCAGSLGELLTGARRLRYPLLLRASFTLGGLGSSVVRDEHELREAYKAARQLSPHPTVVAEEFLASWQEFELEVMRDRRDNCVVVCPLENVDPMGVHTGDSVTVAPIQTLTDTEYQEMRRMAFACIRAVGVETGGSNVQFARDPESGRILLIEMNPRVSRSSALASKATGFPIAAIAAELALGRTLDEIPNEITGRTTAAFEPSIDYVVVKIPQFQLAKFEVRHPWLSTSMKSIGEAMAIGRSFPEALQKAIRSLEEGHAGLDLPALRRLPLQKVLEHVRRANPQRLFYIKEALARGRAVAPISRLSGIHPWFIGQLDRIVQCERGLKSAAGHARWAQAKRLGFGDAQIGGLAGLSGPAVAAMRRRLGLEPAYYEVDTCAGEFEAATPYFYSTYSHGGRAPARRRGSKPRVVILGAGPNRVGEGLEFDYSCVHASLALQELGYESILINSNPETVSTDYDVSTRLYFEPVDFEEVENLLRWERPVGTLLQFGGQNPLNLAEPLKRAGVRILGTPVDAIVKSEERTLFASALKRSGIPYPAFRIARDRSEVMDRAKDLGFPILLRPSFVMGGDRIKIFRDPESLRGYLEASPEVGGRFLVDRFLNPASEVDVDGVSDGRDIKLCGILEHIEPAGIHSGDSSMLYPTVDLSKDCLEKIRSYACRLARVFRIKGLFNLQLAVYKGQPFVLELNARASRTIPFLSKATGVPWAKVATRVLLGESLRDALRRYPARRNRGFYFAKSSAFCFYRFPGPPPPLGPEMRSTGETMGIAKTPEEALSKARLSAGQEPLAKFTRHYCLQEL